MTSELIEHNEQSTRFVVNHGRRAATVNVFNELVEEGEEPAPPPPVRHIVVTEEMRRRDAELQRKREAAMGSAWKIKAELSATNLTGWKPAKLQRGRVQPTSHQVRVAKVPRVVPVRRPRGRPVVSKVVAPIAASLPVVDTTVPRIVCRCGTKIWKRLATRGLCGACYAADQRRAHTLRDRIKCARPACARLARRGTQKRPDGLCGRCGGVVDRRGERQKSWKPCVVCGKLRRPGTSSDRCEAHRKTLRTTLRATNKAEWSLDQAWAAFPMAHKARLLNAPAERS